MEDRWRGLCCCKVVEVKENDKLVDLDGDEEAERI